MSTVARRLFIADVIVEADRFQLNRLTENLRTLLTTTSSGGVITDRWPTNAIVISGEIFLQNRKHPVCFRSLGFSPVLLFYPLLYFWILSVSSSSSLAVHIFYKVPLILSYFVNFLQYCIRDCGTSARASFAAASWCSWPWSICNFNFAWCRKILLYPVPGQTREMVWEWHDAWH